MEMIAKAIGLTQPSLSGWKSGGRPKPGSLEALARLFLSAGLERFTASFLDWGDQRMASVAEAPPATPYVVAETRDEKAAREKRAAKKTARKRQARGGE